MSAERETFDALTVTAAAVVARSAAIALHQVGHALVADAFGAPLEAVTALGVTGRWGALRTAGTLLTSVSGTVANLLVQRQGRWLTPPLSSGCLPGVMRERCLASGLAREGDLGGRLQRGDQAVLINSLSCRPIQSLDGVDQSPISAASAEQLWTHLLK